LLDGLWYSVTNARAPISKSFESKDFNVQENSDIAKKVKSKVRSWITGQRI
jgi:hypothetical protein